VTKILKIFILALPFGWLLSCAAPHDNPLDPASPNYTKPEEPPIEVPDPVFSAIVRSVHKGRTTIDLYSVETEIWPDSNMITDSVTVQYNTTTPRRMTFNPNGHWIRSFNSNNIGDDDLEAGVGMPFTFKFYSPDSVWTTGPLSYERVIHDTPETNSPDSLQTVGPHPTFSWPDFAATFPYRYQLNVEFENKYLAEITTVWTSDTLVSAARSIQYPDTLPGFIDTVPNSSPDSVYYHWTLIVYDAFGNSSVSVEATFNVQAGVDK